MSEEPKVSTYQPKRKKEVEAEPETPKPHVDPMIAVKNLVKSAPLWDSNATAQGMNAFGASYKAWLNSLRRATL